MKKEYVDKEFTKEDFIDVHENIFVIVTPLHSAVGYNGSTYKQFKDEREAHNKACPFYSKEDAEKALKYINSWCASEDQFEIKNKMRFAFGYSPEYIAELANKIKLERRSEGCSCTTNTHQLLKLALYKMLGFRKINEERVPAYPGDGLTLATGGKEIVRWHYSRN